MATSVLLIFVKHLLVDRYWDDDVFEVIYRDRYGISDVHRFHTYTYCYFSYLLRSLLSMLTLNFIRFH